MRSGRPKSEQNKPARQSRAKNNTSTVEQKQPATATPTTARKNTLLSTLCGDPRLTSDDVEAIRNAHEDGINLADLAALTVYELRMARSMFESGDLNAKDLMVALNKTGSHVAAAAQLNLERAPAGANVVVTFAGSGPSSDRPEAKRGAMSDPVVGDLVETE